jgi:GT2 family glycosyltransferase
LNWPWALSDNIDVHLLIVIVNYRTAELTIDCVRSVAEEMRTLPDARVVITDNASPDDSAGRIEEALRQNDWPWATFVRLAINGGFSYGNNAAIRPALAGNDPPKYVLLLNPDTVVRANAIHELLAFLEANPKAGIAGSRLEEPDGTPQRSAFRFPTVLSELDGGLRFGPISKLLARWKIAPPPAEHNTATDWVAGASMIIRKEVFDAIGLLDERYFMYFEEVDFCYRARRAGWRCWYVPSSRVVHLVGQASGVTDTKRPARRRPGYWFDSRRRFFTRNYNIAYAAAADAAWAIGFALWRLRRFLQQKPDNDPPRLLFDFIGHSVFMKGKT